MLSMSAERDAFLSCVERLRQGDQDAWNDIWKEFFPRLASLARTNLQNECRSGGSDEDVALSAFKSFFIRVGSFPQLEDRDDLWRLLMTITLRKCFHANRKSRKYSEADAHEWLQQLPSRDPTPEEPAIIADEIRRVLELLPDDKAREILLVRLTGATQQEAADQIGRSVATVERKWRVIKGILLHETR